MEPNITLIWFVHPQWFQKMGAFSRRENLPVFVEWCETAFKLFGEASAPSHTCLRQLSCIAAKKGACCRKPITSCEWLAWAAIVRASIPGATVHCYCRQEGQAVDDVQRAWRGSPLWARCGQSPSWEAPAFQGRHHSLRVQCTCQ